MKRPNKDNIIKRLNRVEGQVRGIARMIEEDRYCIDVLHQMQAVKAALSRAEDAILADHARSCVDAAIQSGNKKDQHKKFTELVELLGRVKR